MLHILDVCEFVLEEDWLEDVFRAHHVRDEATNVHLVEASNRCNVPTRAIVFCKVPAEATHSQVGWMSIAYASSQFAVPMTRRGVGILRISGRTWPR